LIDSAQGLSTGWEAAGTAPDACAGPGELDRLDWLPAQVPGTAASALRAAGRWERGDSRDFDAEDWWFRTRFDAACAVEGEELTLGIDGIATVADVYLNGEHVLASESMFAAHELDVTDRIGEHNELSIRCRALAPLLGVSRRPRARWRTALVSHGNLRFYRTMLLGRAPGFAPGPATVGPWKPIALRRDRGVRLSRLDLRPRLESGRGVLRVGAALRTLAGAPPLRAAAIELSGPRGTHRAQLSVDPSTDAVSGELSIDNVAPWWPHTHGEPALYQARLLVQAGEEHVLDAGSVGFRALEAGGALHRDGISVSINGVPVFARGAVWTPLDPAMPCSTDGELEHALETVVAAGMNMLRVPGTACYESDRFYELCDRLGILVWQDFMFANLDYPEQDERFMETVQREVRGVLGALARRPSLAVLCGGSEVAQQVAMLGLDPDLADGPLYGELLPSLVAEAEVDAPYIPSSPWGGDLPFRPGQGIAHYYGVGAYLRPLTDARLAEVRFASECLAFANVPDDDALEELGAGGAVVHHPRWKAGVPRDAGAGWDFDDVRDHYLRVLFELDPVALRSTDPERYLELSRAVSGEVMSEVFGEWRRRSSACAGGLVLSLTDLMPGAGWGVLDHRGKPKVAYHHLRRALAPVAVWSTDEGLAGIAAHVANDRPVPLRARLRLALYRDLEIRVDEAQRELELGPHDGCTLDVEQVLGRFVDVSWSYRFGPPAQDLIAISLERDGELLSQCFRLPAGRPSRRERPEQLGLTAAVQPLNERTARLKVSSTRFAYGVRAVVPGFRADDDAFCVEPGGERVIPLRRVSEASGAGSLTALNLDGRVRLEVAA
jgi:beta-mannosidase